MKINHNLLVKKAEVCMGGGKTILTGKGMSRGELRYLYRQNLLRRQLVTLGSGQVIWEWGLL